MKLGFIAPRVLEIPGLFSSPYYIDIDYVRRTFMYNVTPAFPERRAQQLRTLSHILRRFHSVFKVLRFPRFMQISENLENSANLE